MSRELRNNDTGKVVTVYGWAITRHAWEYFFTSSAPSADDIVEAIVYGHEVERGDVSLSEIRPYVMSHTVDLVDLAPPPNWHWVDNEN